VLHDGVDIVTLARFGRHIPAHLRAALEIGDPPDFTGKKCVDCGKRHGLEIDHVNPVANNGPTKLDNLKPRCWTDHQPKTERDRKGGLLKPRRKAEDAGPDPPPPP
jgi:5-methylcytosine-specific restriction endonuclease McrA